MVYIDMNMGLPQLMRECFLVNSATIHFKRVLILNVP